MIKILKSGLHTSIQDSGRFGYRKMGVPLSGFMDSFSAQMANSILGNKSNAAVLEMTMVGAEIQFLEATHIVISGADMSPCLNGISIEKNEVYSISKNDIISFGKLNLGLHTYLAVKDGFISPLILGSQSFYKPLTKKEKLSNGDTVEFNKTETKVSFSRSYSKLKSVNFLDKIFVVQKGPEFDLLSNHKQKELLDTEFKISNLYSRMAYQLSPNFKNDLNSILTSAVLPGTVQLTPSGKLIILMRDCQTTGGYPRVLQLTETAINLLAQKKERDTIKFQIIQ